MVTIDNVVSVLAWVLLGRISMVFPVIATDRRMGPGEIWGISRGNGWRLAIIAGALPFCLRLISQGLLRDGAGSVEMTLVLLLVGAFLIVEVVAVSLSFRILTSRAPPPTNPPA